MPAPSCPPGSPAGMPVVNGGVLREIPTIPSLAPGARETLLMHWYQASAGERKRWTRPACGGYVDWTVVSFSAFSPVRSRERREPRDGFDQILLLACGGRDGASRRGGWGPASSP